MPYKKAYSRMTVKKGGSRTPAKVMGSQGKPARIGSITNKRKATKRTKFK